MTTIQFRRRLIVVVLLAVAVGGAVLRHLAPPASTARDIGTLLMLLWLPIIGNVIAWLVAQVRRPKAVVAEAPSFDDSEAFHSHARVELTLRAPQVPAEDLPVAVGEHRGVVVVQNEGFSARWHVPAGGAFRRGTTQRLDLQFLNPRAAMSKLSQGAEFRMLDGESFIGDGRVLALLADPAQADGVPAGSLLR